MISKQTKILLSVGVLCFASALIWQNYNRSHVFIELSRTSIGAKNGPEGSGGWDPSTLWVHQPIASDILLLVGMFGLLFAVPSLIGDIKRSRRQRQLERK